MKRFEISVVYDGGSASNPSIVTFTKEQALEVFEEAVERAKKEIYQKHNVSKNFYWNLIEVSLDEYYDNDNFETLEYERIER